MMLAELSPAHCPLMRPSELAAEQRHCQGRRTVRQAEELWLQHLMKQQCSQPVHQLGPTLQLKFGLLMMQVDLTPN